MTLRKFTAAFGLAACMATAAMAEDRVKLHDGREFVGEITESGSQYIIIRVTYGGYVKDMTFFRGDIAEIVEDAVMADESAEAEAEAVADATAAAVRPGAEEGSGTVILRLPLTGMVGMEFRHQEIEKVVAYADKLKKEKGIDPIIVLEIESGGGLMSEMYDIHETLMEVKKRHRIVAWIKEAISAAAATAFHCDEIYFRTDGSLGAMTGYAGTTALQGEELQRWLRDAAAWAEAGGRPGLIAKAMIHHPFLVSYDVDDDTGEVTWYDTLEGEYVLSDEETNLTFTSGHAERSGFADGIANSEQELAEKLDMKEWNEDPYAKNLYDKWMETFEKANYEIPMIFGELQIIQGGSLDAEGKLTSAIRLLNDLIDWWKREPDLCRMMGIPSRDELERVLREYQRALAQLRERD